eukprot:359646-Chlamydomonas_euryale.AAC.2
MPARTVVFTALRKFDGESMRWIDAGEYMQMSGRAGRRGIDAKGVCIMMMEEDMPEDNLRAVCASQPRPMDSEFKVGPGPSRRPGSSQAPANRTSTLPSPLPASLHPNHEPPLFPPSHPLTCTSCIAQCLSPVRCSLFNPRALQPLQPRSTPQLDPLSPSPPFAVVLHYAYNPSPPSLHLLPPAPPPPPPFPLRKIPHFYLVCAFSCPVVLHHAQHAAALGDDRLQHRVRHQELVQAVSARPQPARDRGQAQGAGGRRSKKGLRGQRRRGGVHAAARAAARAGGSHACGHDAAAALHAVPARGAHRQGELQAQREVPQRHGTSDPGHLKKALASAHGAVGTRIGTARLPQGI